MNIYGCFTPEFNYMLLFGQLWHVNARSLHIPGVALGFVHSSILESRGQSRDAIHPTSEIGSYISRENILYARSTR